MSESLQHISNHQESSFWRAPAHSYQLAGPSAFCFEISLFVARASFFWFRPHVLYSSAIIVDFGLLQLIKPFHNAECVQSEWSQCCSNREQWEGCPRSSGAGCQLRKQRGQLQQQRHRCLAEWSCISQWQWQRHGGRAEGCSHNRERDREWRCGSRLRAERSMGSSLGRPM